MPSMSSTKKTALTALQKYELCCLRAQNPQMKLGEFALLEECPRRPDGKPLALSSLSDHLKGWRERVKKGPPAGASGNKQKERPSTYPFLEHFLALWIDAAEYAKVPVTDDVIRAQATTIRQELESMGVDEPYDGFEMSNGWLKRFKNRHNFGRLRARGQSGEVDQAALPAQRRHLSEQLAGFSPQDRYNCDESGLVFNKQPQSSNVRLEKGKQLRGGKDDKVRITTFHIVNEAGTDKRKIWVVGRAEKPHAFRQNKVNPANLPVIYRHNKKAWLFTVLWYEFLRGLNDEMRIAQRFIALVTDNCPTHPPPTSPPIDYKGPTPPLLTNITLIYLPPGTTSFLQPLDAGIIASFKAAYRRRYAQFMVQYFNLHGEAPSKLDILQAIYLIAESWESVTQSTIIHCWKKAGITKPTALQASTVHESEIGDPAEEDGIVSPVEQFISVEERECRQAFSDLRNTGLADFQNVEGCFDSYFTGMSIGGDDDDEEFIDTEFALPDAIAIVKKEVAAGILLRSKDSLDQSGSESEEEATFTIPLIGVETAAHYTYELGRYLQALPTTNLPLSMSSSLSVEESICFSHKLHTALLRYRDTRKTKQTTISQFFKPQSAIAAQADSTIRPPPNDEGYEKDGMGKRGEAITLVGKGKEKAIETGLASPVFNWDIDPRYLATSSTSEEEEEEHATCVPTRWKTKGVNTAYENLLR